jgi:CBS domain-containing protein
MRIQDLYIPHVHTGFASEALAAAVGRMCHRHIGALVVIDTETARKPVGILTDRDIVTGQLRRSADLHCLTVGDVMTTEPLVLARDLEINEAIKSLTARGVRRAPVVDVSGALVGIIALDDLLPVLARELMSLSSLVGTQSARERARER